MQLALGGRSLGVAHLLDEDIRIAAITGYPWLVVDHAKLAAFLAAPDFDIRDLKRLFLRAQPAALDGLHLPNSDPAHAPQVEALCREARRLAAPVAVLRVAQPEAGLAALADVAQRWSTVLAVAADTGLRSLSTLVQQLNHPALGLYLDTVALWRAGDTPHPDDAARTVLLAVGDVAPDGTPALPGEGQLPLPALLTPLRAGGYDSLAVLALEGSELPPNPEALAGAARRALAEVLTAAGWVVEASTV